MAEFRPNEAQVSAINEEGKNILVSAGAGSGKTTVLVERVLRMIMEERVSIDSLIIVTFTRAAAAHMKDKIYGRIREALKNEALPEETREHLKGQMMRVFSARICTIDSLCMDLVREYFQYVDIDPAFRIADEAEVNLLMQDVLKELIEDHYAQPTEEYLNFVSCYTDKNDAKLEDMILTLYRFSQSHPEPKRWIERAVGPYLHASRLGNVPDPEENAWLLELAKTVETEEETLRNLAERGLALSGQNGGPYSYEDSFAEVLKQLQRLNGECFDHKAAMIEDMLKEWRSLPRAKKEDGVSDELKESAKGLYAEIKKGLRGLKDRYFYQDLEQMYRDMGKCAGIARTIADLTGEFTERLAEVKRVRQIADFNDVAHLALRVLVQRDAEGQRVYTEAADSIALATHEIIVDEYQDTNRLQDALIEALSSARFGRPNVFMVGDVKQSIYGFRLACPDLFIEKYNDYADGSGTGKRIILGENYRSRKEIVDYINFVFEKIMLPQIGGIDYKDGNEMAAGADFPAAADPEQLAPEIIFIDGGGVHGKIAESYEIARKIEEIVATGYVKDETWKREERTAEASGLRKAKYSDIAILTRRTHHPQLEKMLADRHIPVRKTSGKGFFKAFEIRLALDLLKVIDNPYQDIPLAAVLLSPLAGLDANDLARIKTKDEKTPFCLYKACLSYGAKFADDTSKRLRPFLEQLCSWSDMARNLGFEQFLRGILEESGLYNLCSAMTYGEGRRANLDYLNVLAENFLKGSYAGLFHFLRYLEAMQKADMDFGSFLGSAGAEDAVTMMTIHKSKGLEFPIVILADGGKKILNQESAAPIYLDDTIGVGIEYRDVESRIRKKTLMMETIAAKKTTDLFAEEIRLLYVAMSRARENLIITGSSGAMKSRRKEWEGGGSSVLPDAGSIRKDSSYLFLLADAMACAGEEDRGKFRWTIKEIEEIEMDRAFEIFDEQAQKAKIERMIGEPVSPAQEANSAEHTGREDGREAGPLAADAGIYAYKYPYRSATRTNIKVTASQMGRHETDREDEAEERYPFRIRKEGMLTGAERGNAYHKLFELLDYGALEGALDESVGQQIAAFAEAGYFSEEAAAALEPEKIVRFLLSDIGGRMRNAFFQGTLKREQQFVMAAEIDGNPGGLMQGIIDAFFVEDGERMILVDYKTDRNRSEQYFIERYQEQQKQYAKALESATGLPVAEKILYSVELGREIHLT